MNNKSELLKVAAKKFNIDLTVQQIEQFEKFSELLTAYNTHTNLMSSNDINLIYEKHFVDSLSFGKYIPVDKNFKIIDIGSGGGFPVVPISIVLNSSTVTSVDSTNKKIAFLQSCAKELNLHNLHPIHVRAEIIAFDEQYREKFDFVTARAVGNLSQITELCLPFLKIGGKFIAYKSSKVYEELDEAKNAINTLGGKLIDIYRYNLELSDNFERNLVVIEKTNSTNTNYPRAFATIKKNPL